MISTPKACLRLKGVRLMQDRPSKIIANTAWADFWCVQQKSSCPLICSQTDDRAPLVNECDADALTYGCLCGDNTKPNMSEYSLTIPYFVCREWGTQCVAACDDTDTPCQSSCQQDNPCGALDPERVNTTSTATTAAPTASQTEGENAIYSNAPGGSDDEGGNGGNGDNGAALLGLGEKYGFALIFGSLGLGFAML